MTDLPGLYLSAPHPCSYLEGRTASTAVVDPQFPVSTPVYDALIKHGFRRSGRLVYRPHCHGCRACVSVRIPVQRFVPSRSQRRNLKRNCDVEVAQLPSAFRQEHFRLYRRYQAKRHHGSSMDNPDPTKYTDFLTRSSVDTIFYEMRIGGDLAAVAVADRLSDGLSAIYTFYEPELSVRGLGTFAILRQIDAARHEGLQWLYLGYWIENCQKMDYKIRFRPLEGFLDGRWRNLRG